MGGEMRGEAKVAAWASTWHDSMRSALRWATTVLRPLSVQIPPPRRRRRRRRGFNRRMSAYAVPTRGRPGVVGGRLFVVAENMWHQLDRSDEGQQDGLSADEFAAIEPHGTLEWSANIGLVSQPRSHFDRVSTIDAVLGFCSSLFCDNERLQSKGCFRAAAQLCSPLPNALCCLGAENSASVDTKLTFKMQKLILQVHKSTESCTLCEEPHVKENWSKSTPPLHQQRKLLQFSIFCHFIISKAIAIIVASMCRKMHFCLPLEALLCV